MKTSSRKLTCCICGTNQNSKDLKRVESYLLKKCHNCSLVFQDVATIDPESFLDDANSELPAGSAEYWGYPEFAVKYGHVFNHFFKERFERIQKERPIAGAWLDIGSGFGLWQTFLTSRGVENFGIEIEKNAFNYSRSIKLNTEFKSIENFETTQKFSVITMCDVLEHVEEPASVLLKIKEMLTDEGLLYIQVPNVMGIKIPFGDHLGLPHHLWQFSPATLTALAKNNGYEVIHYWTGIQGVIKYYELGGPRFYHQWYWNLARLLKIGNRLQVLLRKNSAAKKTAEY